MAKRNQSGLTPAQMFFRRCQEDTGEDYEAIIRAEAKKIYQEQLDEFLQTREGIRPYYGSIHDQVMKRYGFLGKQGEIDLYYQRLDEASARREEERRREIEEAKRKAEEEVQAKAALEKIPLPEIDYSPYVEDVDGDVEPNEAAIKKDIAWAYANLDRCTQPGSKKVDVSKAKGKAATMGGISYLYFAAENRVEFFKNIVPRIFPPPKPVAQKDDGPEDKPVDEGSSRVLRLLEGTGE